MLSIESQNGNVVFYNKLGQPVSKPMTVDEAISLLRGENNEKTQNQE